MTDKGFEVFATDKAVFGHQLSSLKDVPLSGIKLGLLPNVDIAEQALDFVKVHDDLPVVLDPVLVCKESHDVEVSALRDELLKFFPHTAVITPNLAEAELLTQMPIKNLDDMKAAAKCLYHLGAKNVVVKGGTRLSSKRAIDVFFDGEKMEVLDYPLLANNNISQFPEIVGVPNILGATTSPVTGQIVFRIDIFVQNSKQNHIYYTFYRLYQEALLANHISLPTANAIPIAKK
jgi:hydroxymethylpyrimidine/phosphomethylpyrimidine kinase